MKYKGKIQDPLDLVNKKWAQKRVFTDDTYDKDNDKVKDPITGEWVTPETGDLLITSVVADTDFLEKLKGSEFETATAANLNEIYICTETYPTTGTAEYIEGHIYKCELVGTEYKWVDVGGGSSANAIEIVTALPTTDIKDKCLYQVGKNLYKYDTDTTSWISITQTEQTSTGFKSNAKLWKGTKAEYNSITTKDDDTIYLITDDDTSTVEVDDVTIGKTTDNKLQVKDEYITLSSTGTSTNEIKYIKVKDTEYKIAETKTDNVTIEKNTEDKLQVKDASISKSKVTTDFFKDNDLVGNTSIDNLTVNDSCIVPVPTMNNQATTKNYVDARVQVNALGTSTDEVKYITIGDTEYKIGGEVKVDNITIDKLTDGSLEVKDAGITLSKLDSDLISKAIPTSGASTGKLASEKAVYDGLEELKEFNYICSTDSSESTTPFSNYITPNNSRCTINSGAIVKVGRVYQLRLEFYFTTTKATWAANTEWLNLLNVTDAFKAICKGFDSSYKDPQSGNYGGAFGYAATASSISIFPWKQITTSGLTSTLFRANAMWIN